MEDPEIKEIFDKFIENQELDEKTKLRKMKKILLEFSDRWAEERTMTAKYRDKCYELLEYMQKAFVMIEKLRNQVIYEQKRNESLGMEVDRSQNSPNKAKEDELKHLVIQLRNELQDTYVENQALRAEIQKSRSPQSQFKY